MFIVREVVLVYDYRTDLQQQLPAISSSMEGAWEGACNRLQEGKSNRNGE
jgi:hypothetical protein